MSSPRRPTPRRSPPASSSADATHDLTVVLEEIRAHGKAVMELVLGCATKSDVADLRTGVDDLRSGVEMRIEVLEAAVWQHSYRLGAVETEVRGMRADLHEIGALVAGKATRPPS